MEFHKWTEIENLETEQKKESKSFLMAKSIKEWVVTEKIDGTNFGLNITKDAWSFNSRNNMLDLTSSFYDIYSNSNLLKTVICRLEEYLNEHTEISQITLQGEYFGRKVMNRINYNVDYDFRFFGGYYINGNGKNTYSFEELVNLLTEISCSEFLIPIIGTYTTFARAIQEKNDRMSLINPNSVMEGIVIMPYSVPYNYDGYDLIFKNKNEVFKEKANKINRVKDDLSDNDYIRLVQLKESFKDYITESRMYSVISKLGKPTSEKEYGKYVNPFIEDAYKDFLKDNEGLTLTDKERKFVTNIGSDGFIIFSVIVAKLNEE